MYFFEELDNGNQFSELEDYYTKCLDITRRFSNVDPSLISELVNKSDFILPKKPKKDLISLLNSFKKIEDKKFNAHKFNSQLLKMQISNVEIPIISLPETEEDIANFLQVHKNSIIKSQAQTFYIQCIYGFYLEKYYIKFISKNSKKWKIHVKEQFNINDRQARNLRSVGVLTEKFPKLRHLSISLRRFLCIENKIKLMLEEKDYATIWT